MAEQNGSHTCQYCGAETYEDVVRVAMWEEEKLVVIEDVPARTCKGCLEQYYDELTTFKIDKLRGSRFPIENAQRVIQVPVFSLAEAKTPANSE